MSTSTHENHHSGTNGPVVDGDFSDLLQELRVLLQGVQVLTGFLIVLPFSEGFARVSDNAKIVYLVMFLCVLSSLVLFSAPAAQHRLLTPLHDRVRFKHHATRLIILGLIPLSISMVLAAQFVVNEVLGELVANIVAAVVAAIVGILWWYVPIMRRRQRKQPGETSF